MNARFAQAQVFPDAAKSILCDVYRSILAAVRDGLLELVVDLEQDMPDPNPKQVTRGQRDRVRDMFSHAIFNAPVGVVNLAQTATGDISQSVQQPVELAEIRRLLGELRIALAAWDTPEETRDESLVYVEQISAELEQ